MNSKLKWAHSHSSNNRKEIETSNICGCFYCLEIFSPDTIEEWINEETTALCPYCEIDSVIGSASKFKIEKNFLEEMKDYWF